MLRQSRKKASSSYSLVFQFIFSIQRIVVIIIIIIIINNDNSDILEIKNKHPRSCNSFLTFNVFFDCKMKVAQRQEERNVKMPKVKFLKNDIFYF